MVFHKNNNNNNKSIHTRLGENLAKFSPQNYFNILIYNFVYALHQAQLSIIKILFSYYLLFSLSHPEHLTEKTTPPLHQHHNTNIITATPHQRPTHTTAKTPPSTCCHDFPTSFTTLVPTHLHHYH